MIANLKRVLFAIALAVCLGAGVSCIDFDDDCDDHRRECMNECDSCGHCGSGCYNDCDDYCD